MLKSLKKDPSLATYEEWDKAGDYACEIRFFPHAFSCYQNAFSLNKNQEIAEKLNTILDKVTNVLEIVPETLKENIEEFRLSNPLDPEKWLALANKLLKEEGTKEVFADYSAAKLALAFCCYCSLRSMTNVQPINEILIKLIEPVDMKSYKPAILEYDAKAKGEEPIKVVAFGDNVTLGLQGPWEIKFRDTYHYQWSNDSGQIITLANCGISGAGAMDALMYLKRDVVNYNPDITFLNFGMNDAWLGHAALLAYEILLENVVHLLKPHTQVILVGPTPHIPEFCPENERPTGTSDEEVEIGAWHESCRKVAAKANVPFADVLAEFPSDANERKKLFANGFNHPNAAGHELIKKAIDKVLRFV